MSIDVERALRGALAARAAQITPERLQPAVPPTAMPARRSASSLAGRLRWLLLAGVTMLLVAVVVAVHPPGPGPDRRAPERPASSVPPSPSTSPSPSPSASPTSTPSTSPSPARPAAPPAGTSVPRTPVPASSVPASSGPASSGPALSTRTAGSTPGTSAAA